ncbi:MAG: RcpC/CpaB family pilus assembly protein [Elusimicrobiota bacterium]
MRVSRMSAVLALAFATAAYAAEDQASVRLSKEEVKYERDSKGMVEGYRGLTMPISGHQVAFISEGDRVDVLVTFDAQMKDKVKEKVTATILQNVIVVKVSKPQKLDEMGAVQLLVNPNEAQYAALAWRQGDCTITLRKENDVKMEPMEMAAFRKLFR